MFYSRVSARASKKYGSRSIEKPPAPAILEKWGQDLILEKFLFRPNLIPRRNGKEEELNGPKRKNCSFLHSGEGGVLVIAIVPLQHVHGGILVANNDPLQHGIVAEQAVRQRVPQSL